jgi:hypothetical protein
MLTYPELDEFGTPQLQSYFDDAVWSEYLESASRS